VFEILVESKKARKKFINESNDEVKSYDDIWPDINLQTTDTFDHYLKEDVPSEQDIVCIMLMKMMWKHVCKSRF